MADVTIPPPLRSAAAERLRADVRQFLDSELRGVPPSTRTRSWSGFDAAFSRKVAERGWIGMTWPKRYGGHERSGAERYVVLEEMLAAGAPVAAHWFADRQTGPLLLKFGTEEQRRIYLPRIAAGELFTCIGMSEPDAGSDLAAVRTRAVPVPEGFRVSGTKLWTSHAQHAHRMVLFCRTSGGSGDRQSGTSQLFVDLSSPGICIRPISDLAGEQHFNEVHFDDAFVPETDLIGELGNGWAQVMSELAYERSGPERFLSCMTLLNELIRALGESASDAAITAIGRLSAHLIVLRQMSRGVAAMLEQGRDPSLQAAFIKDLGALFEQEIPEVARSLLEPSGGETRHEELRAVLAYTTLTAPSFSLRGGTREILRGIIARGLGIR